MPASLHALSARKRACGADARGSIRDDSLLSSEVIENATATSRRAASGASRSRSRSTSAFLVMMWNGCPHSASTSISARVMPYLRSLGW
jgi:hypothetical protein